MSRDHYAVLGVTPTSEDVVIRAAYRALMRRYHPDADPSSEASQKAQAINAAYSVLSDPEKRARYDGSLAAQGMIRPEPAHRPRRRAGASVALGLAAAGAVAAVVFITPPSAVMSTQAPDAPAAADKPVDRAVARNEVQQPPLRPPARTVETKAAEKELPARPDPIPEQADRDRTPPKATTPKVQVAANPVDKSSPRPAQIAQASGTPARQPDASCRLGSGWAERTICGSSNLTALDRQLGLLYGQSWGKADESKRAVLLSSRGRFQDRKSACRSESCLTSAYVARLREISDIMARGSPQ